MTALFWMLTWLPLVLPAVSKLPMPVNITLTPSHFSHVLKWEPGPGTPAEAYYHVSIKTERGTSWEPVAGCEHVQKPLVCNLTEVFSDPVKIYITRVRGLMEAQVSEAAFIRYKPITHMDLPLLTVTSCGRDLCVDLQPPMERLRESYDILSYQLQIKSNSRERAQFFKNTWSLRREILEDLAPGRQYCVSVRFSDSLEDKKSNFSKPVCAFTPGIYPADPLISAMLCVLVVAAVVVMALLVYAGFMLLKRRPLPSVLASIHHIDEVLVVTPCSTSLASLLNIKAMTPSAGEKRSRQSLSYQSDEESAPENTNGSTGGDYKLRVGIHLFSSSSSSSSLLALLSPKAQPPPRFLSIQPSEFFNPQPKSQISADTHSSAGLNHTLRKDTDSVTGERIEVDEGEKEEVGEDSQDVNLLTLTFGRHLSMPEEEPESSSATECSTTPVLPSQSRDTKEADTETVSWCADEEEEEEIDKLSGYMGRLRTDFLQNLF